MAAGRRSGGASDLTPTEGDDRVIGCGHGLAPDLAGKKRVGSLGIGGEGKPFGPSVSTVRSSMFRWWGIDAAPFGMRFYS
jgi:hypothetical protein